MRPRRQLFRSQAILRLVLAPLFFANLSAVAQHKFSSPQPAIRNADVSAGIFGQFTSSIAATSQPIAQSTNDSAGALFSFHKSDHWWLGFDANYGYAGFSEYYRITFGSVCGLVCGFPPPANARVATSMHEFTGAYLVKSPISLLGLRPYGEVGLGDLVFVPAAAETALTYQTSSQKPIVPPPPPSIIAVPLNISAQNCFAGLYSIGIDAPLWTRHIGVRLEYRGLAYKAPSFGNSFLHSNHSVLTQEPVASLYFKF
ncbi:MAG TPA: hypothetical protein VFN53_05130 [Acidobacteriaceae bacterium]|nr:hypothetical protein [Acidobacteriaceae bacterium]